MKQALKIFRYVFLDLVKNRVIVIYTLILALLSFTLLSFDSNVSKGILSLLNITLLFVPVITILFSTIYFFNSIEFIELLLAQPVKRRSLIYAEYFGLSISLSLAYLLGFGLPIMYFAMSEAGLYLVASGILLTFTFSALALLIFVLFKDKTKAIGAAIIAALFFTFLYDGLQLGFIYSFSDYPIEKPVLLLNSLNPVDLARIMVLLKLDVAVLMGYSGALFKMFLGSAAGTIYSLALMILWTIIPLLISVRIFKRKNL